MRRLSLISIIFLLCIVAPLAAQDAAPDTGWPIEQRCVGDPTPPPDDWTYDGTIFLRDSQSIHALRSNVSTPYYVAFNSDEFIWAGAISPDGKWFAVPSGYVDYYVSASDDVYNVDEIRVYSTDPKRTKYSFPWSVSYRSLRSNVEMSFTPIRWLDNEHIVYESGSWARDPYQVSIINPFTLETQPFEASLGFLFAQIISPDFTQTLLIYGSNDILEVKSGETVALIPGLWSPSVSWTADSSDFSAMIHKDNVWQIALFNRDGELTDIMLTLPAFEAYSFEWSSDEQTFALLIGDNPNSSGNRIFVGNMENRTIIELCQIANSIGLSSHGEKLALASTVEGLGQAIQILDLQQGNFFTIAYHYGNIIGWRTD